MFWRARIRRESSYRDKPFFMIALKFSNKPEALQVDRTNQLYSDVVATLRNIQSCSLSYLATISLVVISPSHLSYSNRGNRLSPFLSLSRLYSLVGRAAIAIDILTRVLLQPMLVIYILSFLFVFVRMSGQLCVCAHKFAPRQEPQQISRFSLLRKQLINHSIRFSLAFVMAFVSSRFPCCVWCWLAWRPLIRTYTTWSDMNITDLELWSRLQFLSSNFPSLFIVPFFRANLRFFTRPIRWLNHAVR